METANYLVPGTAEIRASLETMRREREEWEVIWRSSQKAQPTLADLMVILQQLVGEIGVLKAMVVKDQVL
jgi:hypothetical protein